MHGVSASRYGPDKARGGYSAGYPPHMIGFAVPIVDPADLFAGTCDLSDLIHYSTYLTNSRGCTICFLTLCDFFLYSTINSYQDTLQS